MHVCKHMHINIYITIAEYAVFLLLSSCIPVTVEQMMHFKVLGTPCIVYVSHSALA